MLREYQQKPVQDAKALLAQSVPTILVAPTGAGKTVMAAEIIADTVAAGGHVLFLAHRKELLKQAKRAAAAHGLDKHPQLTIMGIGRARRHGPDHADLLVIDEAHRAAAKTYRLVLAKYPKAKRLGLTATPERTDGQGLDDIFQSMVQTAGLRELIDGGHLCDFRLLSAKDKDLRELEVMKRKSGDYDKAELGRRMNTPKLVGFIVEHWGEHAMADKRPTIVFAASRLHARSIRDAFRAAGVRAEAVDGLTAGMKRKHALEDLATGRLDVLVSVDLFTEGWDCPPVACVIHARPTLSQILWLQSVGRGLRQHPGKTDLLILDHAGNFDRHGFPDEEREWSLEGEQARKALEREHVKAQRDLEMAELAAALEEKKQRFYTSVQAAKLLSLTRQQVTERLADNAIENMGNQSGALYARDAVERFAELLGRTYSSIEVKQVLGLASRANASAWARVRGIYPVPESRNAINPRFLRSDIDAAIQTEQNSYSASEVAQLLGTMAPQNVCQWYRRNSDKVRRVPVGRRTRYIKSDIDALVRQHSDVYSVAECATLLQVKKGSVINTLNSHGIQPCVALTHCKAGFSKVEVDVLAEHYTNPRRPKAA